MYLVLIVVTAVCVFLWQWVTHSLSLTHCLHELECQCFPFIFLLRNPINLKIMSSALGLEPMKPQINVPLSAMLCLEHPSNHDQEQTPHHSYTWETTYIQKNIACNLKSLGCYYPVSWWRGSPFPTVAEPEMAHGAGNGVPPASWGQSRLCPLMFHKCHFISSWAS